MANEYRQNAPWCEMCQSHEVDKEPDGSVRCECTVVKPQDPVPSYWNLDRNGKWIYKNRSTTLYTKFDAKGNELQDSAESWAMVKDNETGLIWEVKTDDGSIHDKDNEYDWNDAQDVFIAKLNAEKFGGYSNWRLPSRKELLSIVNDTKVKPATDLEISVLWAFYWSGTPKVITLSDDHPKSWGIDYLGGECFTRFQKQQHYVVAVCKGSPDGQEVT